MVKLAGACYCRNIHLDLELSRSLDSYNPRTCDCDFCRKHGASYISDPNGALSIHVQDQHLLRKYQQGSGTADFLVCLKCGVLVAVAFEDVTGVFAAVNSQVIEGDMSPAHKMVISPKTLSVDEKIKRWKEVWFSNVRIGPAKS